MIMSGGLKTSASNIPSSIPRTAPRARVRTQAKAESLNIVSEEEKRCEKLQGENFAGENSTSYRLLYASSSTGSAS